MRAAIREHSLSIVLTIILVLMLVASFLIGMHEFTKDALDHGQPFVWPDFLMWWSYETITSLEADVFGAILLVLFTKKFMERGSPESGDVDK